jgi:hypothetical protein
MRFISLCFIAMATLAIASPVKPARAFKKRQIAEYIDEVNKDPCPIPCGDKGATLEAAAWTYSGDPTVPNIQALNNAQSAYLNCIVSESRLLESAVVIAEG